MALRRFFISTGPSVRQQRGATAGEDLLNGSLPLPIPPPIRCSEYHTERVGEVTYAKLVEQTSADTDTVIARKLQAPDGVLTY
jgi:hypothetical protein